MLQLKSMTMTEDTIRKIISQLRHKEPTTDIMRIVTIALFVLYDALCDEEQHDDIIVKYGTELERLLLEVDTNKR